MGEDVQADAAGSCKASPMGLEKMEIPCCLAAALIAAMARPPSEAALIRSALREANEKDIAARTRRR